MMKKILLFALVLVQACATGVPYQKNKPMNFDHSIWEGRHFIQDNHIVNYSEAMDALSSDPKSSKVMTSAKMLEGFGWVAAIGGGVAAGYGLASYAYLDKSKREDALIYIGFAAMIGSLLLENASSKKVAQAIDLYNEQFPDSIKPVKSSKIEGTGFQFGLNGFAVHF